MKLFIVNGEPSFNEAFIMQMRKEELFTDVVAVCSKKATSDFRKYGQLGWFITQYIQFSVAVKAIRLASSDDIVLGTNYGVGRLCSFWAQLTCRKRKVLAVNCLQVRVSGLKRIIEKVIDFFAWKNPEYYTTANTKEDIEGLAIPEEMKKRVYLLQDMFTIGDEPERLVKEYDCMTGGYANRDFETFFYAAEKLPNKKFVCITGSNFVASDYKIPKNCDLFQDIPMKEYNKIMQKSHVIAIPLKSAAASGLVMLQTAINLRSLYLVSDIPATSNFFPPDQKEIKELCTVPIGDKSLFFHKLERLFLVNEEERKSIFTEIISYTQRYSVENTAIRICDFFREWKWIH